MYERIVSIAANGHLTPVAHYAASRKLAKKLRWKAGTSHTATVGKTRYVFADSWYPEPVSAYARILKDRRR